MEKYLEKPSTENIRSEDLRTCPPTPLSSFCYFCYPPKSSIRLLFLQDFSLKEWICYFCFSGKIKSRKINMAWSLMQNWDLLFPSTAAIWLNSVLNFVQISDVFFFFFPLNGFCFKMEQARKKFHVVCLILWFGRKTL